MNFKKILAAAISAMMLNLASAANEPLKVGFIYVGPIGDFGWSYQHDQGRLALEKKFGDKIKTSYMQEVKEGADAQRAIAKLVEEGNKLVFTTSFGFMNPTLKVAKRNPQVKFEHATGYKQANNVSTYSSRFYEGRYIAGMLAGKMTKSNTIGYVASFPIPEVIRGINATLLGARSVNPDAKIKVVWVNSWYDPAKETNAAKSLIASGADVLMQHTDSPAIAQIAEEKGAWVVGQATDMKKFAPTKQLTAIIDDWSHYYVDRVGKVLDGTWESKDTWGGFAEKMVDLAAFNEQIPAETREKATQVKEAITNKTFHPFTGPITSRDGKVVAKEGEVISDKALLGMNYFVEGVEGNLPK